jgi:hypothetical protein
MLQGTLFTIGGEGLALADQIKQSMITNTAPRTDAYRGVPTVQRRAMELQQAQDKINNTYNDSKLSGYYNGKPTLDQMAYEHGLAQDKYNNGLKIGQLMGDYNGVPTLDNRALAIKQAQFNAQMAQDDSQFNQQMVASGSLPKAKVSGNVTSWLTEALKLTGQSLDALPYLEIVAQHESGGDPTAVNNWDSNAKAGHPSKGLMQTIDGTFNTYKLPGHEDIYNPVDNAVAAIRYAIKRYGSLSNIPGIKTLSTTGKYIGY